MNQYKAHIYEKDDISHDTTVKIYELNQPKQVGILKYNKMMLVAEVARLMGPEVSCLTVKRLIEHSVEGLEKFLIS